MLSHEGGRCAAGCSPRKRWGRKEDAFMVGSVESGQDDMGEVVWKEVVLAGVHLGAGGKLRKGRAPRSDWRGLNLSYSFSRWKAVGA